MSEPLHGYLQHKLGVPPAHVHLIPNGVDTQVFRPAFAQDPTPPGFTLGRLLGPRRPSGEKLSPYECGFAAFEDAHIQFDVRYYLIAIMFIAFDLEIAFVFPWAVIFRDLGFIGLVEMGIFLGLLLLGFVYVWKKGALEWE